MAELLNRLIGIISLRLGPQDLPPGPVPLMLTIGLYIAMSTLTMTVGQAPENPMAFMLLATLLPLVLVRIVLGIRKRPQRWAQTLSALYGSSALLMIVSLPLTAMTGPEEPSVIAVLVGLALFIWSFVVDAHIWRHALEVSFATGLAVAVVLFAVTFFVINSLAGPL